MTSFKVGIAGFAGYSGAELVRLLRAHPQVEPVLLTRPDSPGSGAHGAGAHGAGARHMGAGTNGDPLSPTAGLARLPLSEAALRGAELDAAMLATPPEASMSLAPLLLEAGAKVIDLSGAFRLPADEYRRYYRAEHQQPALLPEAVYGLPELGRDAIRQTRLVANPGCYATAAILALQPLVAAELIDRRAGVVVDAKSGVTGAGKRPSEKTHFCSVADNFSAYGFFEHRHSAEILRNAGLREPELSFVTQLLPLRRGILACVYWRLPERTGEPLGWSDVAAAYRSRYGDEPLVELLPEGQVPDLHSVVHTPRCHLGIKVDAPSRRALVVATLDNLLKGAASQAVQNLNLLLDLPETTALAASNLV